MNEILFFKAFETLKLFYYQSCDKIKVLINNLQHSLGNNSFYIVMARFIK